MQMQPDVGFAPNVLTGSFAAPASMGAVALTRPAGSNFVIRDRFGGLHRQGQTPAMDAFEMAVQAVLRHRPALMFLGNALSLDPDFIAARALKGFCNVLLARRETLAIARQDAAAVCALVEMRGASPGEVALSHALTKASHGYIHDAVVILSAHAESDPLDLLLIKLVHGLQFLGGRSGDLAAFTAGVLSHWDERRPGHGYILGCHAFGLEEIGQFRKAEAAAQSALNLDTRDLWAMHALAHVYEMNGRNREGIIWVESARDLWSDAANFSYHLAWHLALFNFNLGKFDRVLDLYDKDIRNAGGDDFRDIANAVSLLWRLRQAGVAIGGRFDELADVARRRSSDLTLAFASLHHLLSLIAVGDHEAAGALVASMEGAVQNRDDDQARVMRDAGLQLARLLVGFAGENCSCGGIMHVANLLPMLGGSHAQRDVFMRTLAMIAAENGDRTSLDQVLGLRHSLLREDHFLKFVEARAKEAALSGSPALRVA